MKSKRTKTAKTAKTNRFPVSLTCAALNSYPQECFLKNPNVDVLLTPGDANLENYVEFCGRHKRDLWGYLVPEGVDPEETMDNLVFMQEDGLNPIPVFSVDLGDHQGFESLFKEAPGVLALSTGGVSVNVQRLLTRCGEWAGERFVLWDGYAGEGLVAALRPYGVILHTWGEAGKVYLGCGRWWSGEAQDIPQSVYRLLSSCDFGDADIFSYDIWKSVGIYSSVKYVREFRERFGTRVFLDCTEVPKNQGAILVDYISKTSPERRL